uniref:Mechanosensitive ion channel protein 1 n=1 Tax=Rhizophora mucronata TaxID=61149 RepID=A0A2P2ISC3_RHIMU
MLLISFDIWGTFPRLSSFKGILVTIVRHWARDLFTMTWLENNEFGTTTGNFSAFSNEVEVSPICTT